MIELKIKNIKNKILSWLRTNPVVLFGILCLVGFTTYMAHGLFPPNPSAEWINQTGVILIQYTFLYSLFTLGTLLIFSPLSKKEEPTLYLIISCITLLPLALIFFILRRLKYPILAIISLILSFLFAFVISWFVYIFLAYSGIQLLVKFDFYSTIASLDGIYFLLGLFLGIFHAFTLRWSIIIGSKYIFSEKVKTISKKKATYITIIITVLLAFLIHLYTIIFTPGEDLNTKLDYFQDGLIWYSSLYALYEIFKEKIIVSSVENE